MLNREAILAKNDLLAGTVEVPEWGGEVGILVLTVDQRERVFDLYRELEAVQDPHEKGKQYTRTQFVIVSMGLADLEGNRLFGDDDVQALGNKNPVVIGRLHDAIVEKNGFAAKAVEEAAKN